MPRKARTTETIETIRYDGRDVYLVAPMDELLKALGTALSMRRQEQRLYLMVGEQGTGKTLGSKLFCSQHPRETVYLSVPPASVMRAGRLLQVLEQALDLPIRGAPNLFDRLQAIVAHLRVRPRMLVIDEANRIRREEYLDMLRFVHDEAGAQIAFVSLPPLEHTFRRYPELAGRVQLCHRLGLVTAEEARSLLSDLPPETVTEIHEISGGRMREIVVLAGIFREGDLEREHWTAEMVQKLATKFTLRPA